MAGPSAPTLATYLLPRFGVRPVLVAGGALIPVGAILFLLLGPDASPIVAGVGSVVVGFGMGLLSNSSLVLIQEIVDWSERGSATASFLFARSLGSTFGATIFGAVLNFGLLRSGTVVSSDQLRGLLDGTSHDGNLTGSIRAALESSLHLTFLTMFAIALLTAAIAALVPKVKLTLHRVPADSSMA